MKERLHHFVFVLRAVLVIAGGISIFFNQASYNPEFSVMDAISGATKKSRHNRENNKKDDVSNEESDEELSIWKYTREDLALSEDLDINCVEETITIVGKSYTVLINTRNTGNLKNISSLEENVGTGNMDTADALVLFSNTESEEYQNAVQTVSEYLENQGYPIRIKECNEMMMLSFVHAGHFDLFLMSEEVAE
ncbi:hypothetical protein [Brotaphodocola sp.]|uniref:hypothetical protein n=1 Tax=Brotaphodocola sp. TaxID=3073577 RepID=UPI003D7EB7BE